MGKNDSQLSWMTVCSRCIHFDSLVLFHIDFGEQCIDLFAGLTLGCIDFDSLVLFHIDLGEQCIDLFAPVPGVSLFVFLSKL